MPWRNVWTDGLVFPDNTNDILSTAEIYIVHSGGHYEPSISEQYSSFGNLGEMILGTQCHDFEIAQVVCDFFKAHILQGETDISTHIGAAAYLRLCIRKGVRCVGSRTLRHQRGYVLYSERNRCCLPYSEIHQHL